MNWFLLSDRSRSYQAAEIRQRTLSGYYCCMSRIYIANRYDTDCQTLQLCSCGQSIDDLEHFLLECNQYQKARQELVSAITDVWYDSENSEKWRISVPVLLALAVNSDFSSSVCRSILSCTFKWMHQSGRIL